MLAILAGGFVLGVALAVVAAIVMDPAIAQTHRIDPLAAIVGQGALDLTMIVVALRSIPRAAQFSLRELGFTPPDLRAVGIALAAVPVAILAVTLIVDITSALTHQPQQEQTVIQLFRTLGDPWKIGMFAIFGTIVGPISEEIIFRVVLFNAGLRYRGFWFGAILSSILFGLAHFDLANALALACVGLILASVYYISRNAFASMITHACFNGVSLAVLVFFPKAAGF